MSGNCKKDQFWEILCFLFCIIIGLGNRFLSHIREVDAICEVVCCFGDLIACGNELMVKEAGKFRLEGKDYLMQDGDICHFRFNK